MLQLMSKFWYKFRIKYNSETEQNSENKCRIRGQGITFLDDDFAKRIGELNLKIERPPTSIARYKMIKHKPQDLNQKRYELLKKTTFLRRSDGLNQTRIKAFYFKVDIVVFRDSFVVKIDELVIDVVIFVTLLVDFCVQNSSTIGSAIIGFLVDM
ncbi:beta-1-4-galactosyltransferase 3-like, partial [Brachionus plicatilis]